MIKADDNTNLIFDREKLEKCFAELKDEHTVEPTKQFWREEMERCEDPVYFYNNYWMAIDKDGTQISPNPITYEQYEALQRKMRSSVHRDRIAIVGNLNPINFALSVASEKIVIVQPDEVLDVNQKPIEFDVPQLIDNLEVIDLKKRDQPFYKFNAHKGGNKNKRNRRY